MLGRDKSYFDSTKKFSEADIIEMLELFLSTTCLLYLMDVFSLSLNNYRFGDFVDHIYPIELEIKNSTDTDRSASHLDIHLEIDSEGQFRRKLYAKRYDFNVHIVNFPFICSNISAAPAYGVYISDLIRYSRACGSYQEFLERGLLLARKLRTERRIIIG